jgi:hypothetical protein
MHADEPIVRVSQDPTDGRFYVERDGIQVEEACHRGTKSDDVMRADGYRPVAEVYPEVTEAPRVPGVELDELYVRLATDVGAR